MLYLCSNLNFVYCILKGHGWGALFIAGNDEDHTTAKAFSSDVRAFEEVVTSKILNVMGIE